MHEKVWYPRVMATDPVVEEVRRIRRLYAERFDYDIHAMVDALRKEQQKHPERLVTFPSKPPQRGNSTSGSRALPGASVM